MSTSQHAHVFLGDRHAQSERKTWIVIWLCGAMMLAEIAGGVVFGSIALVADGLHMSTHAGALLLAALAYTYSRKHTNDPRFTFGTGKLGDLAGFTSAIVLSMVALVIGYESITRLITPVPIRFAEAIPIAALGLTVNLISAWLLGGDDHGHSHGSSSDVHHHDDVKRFETRTGEVEIEIFEHGARPRFRLRSLGDSLLSASATWVETVRADGKRQRFAMGDHQRYLESVDEIPEPHAFVVQVHSGDEEHRVVFKEHQHAGASTHRDNNMRAAVVHVIADAAVSVLVIVGLLLARSFGWLWMDPLAGILGAVVISSWAYGLVRDTGAILLDMNPDRGLGEAVRQTIERSGDTLADLHLWRLGPGHLGAIISVVTKKTRDAGYYRDQLSSFRSISHLTIEVRTDATHESLVG